MDPLKFFADLGFNCQDDLKKATWIDFGENTNVGKEIAGSIYFYQSPPQRRTSFYFIGKPLTDNQQLELHKYFWNENKADLFFTLEVNKQVGLLGFNEPTYNYKLHYAKTPPYKKIKEIYNFRGRETDKKKLNTIRKWQFDSGAFWSNYQDFYFKIKNLKSIDKELIDTLKQLKADLEIEVVGNEIVQALIDRTLFIKYLEDNHIINSYFYQHYFNDKDLTYSKILEFNDRVNLNLLFTKVQELFNNALFDNPNINETQLTDKVCYLLYNAIKATDLVTKQLSLFAFQFNVLPVEFISYVYEVFLKEKQSDGGIYYTPKKLAQLLVDDVIPINKLGKVLDPACGSGMFLIVAYQKLLDNFPISPEAPINEKIEHRLSILKTYIFGIEKEPIAQRLAIFSLSLQVFRDLPAREIKEYIADQLKTYNQVMLFKKYKFKDNILCQNTLDLKKKPFEGQIFDFIVGNPPFFQIKEDNNKEGIYLQKAIIEVDGKKKLVKDIVGKKQISQCFLLKIKDWATDFTRFGFVCNSSNFYNDYSDKFQNFFYKNYNIETIYELSKVKKILFENANESVNALVFTNTKTIGNIIAYYPVDLGLFHEKPFDLLIIQEDKVLEIIQEELIEQKVRLRDYLVGNSYDIELIKKLTDNVKLKDFLFQSKPNKYFAHCGIKIWGEDARKKVNDFKKSEWETKSSEERELIKNTFKENNIKIQPTNEHPNKYILYTQLEKFKIGELRFIGEIDKFDRAKGTIIELFSGQRIIFNRSGDSLNAVFINEDLFFDDNIYAIKLRKFKLCYLICSILNSKLLNALINMHFRKRSDGTYPKIGIEDILQIPIPNPIEMDENLVKDISRISKDLTDGRYPYKGEIVTELNELIYDLYGLTFLEKQRIKDYFIGEGELTTEQFELYQQALKDTIEVFLINPITITRSKNEPFGLVVVKISFVPQLSDGQPEPGKVAKYLLNEIFEKHTKENFLALNEKIFGDDCMYIVRTNNNKNWTETKAFEDGQAILNNLK